MLWIYSLQSNLKLVEVMLLRGHENQFMLKKEWVLAHVCLGHHIR
jgi:hypothetical protein